MGFYDAFFGSDQSLYTAYSIIAAIIAICLTILLTATDIPLGNRILIVLFVIITLIPSIFLTLFELTCIVTGGTEPNRWWCHAFAWILAAFIIIYCIIVVIVSLVSLFNYNKAIHTVNNEEQKYKISNNESDNYAKEIIEADEVYTKKLEKFYGGGSYERFVADVDVGNGSSIQLLDGIGAANARGDKPGNPNVPISDINRKIDTDVQKFENMNQSMASMPSMPSIPSMSSNIESKKQTEQFEMQFESQNPKVLLSSLRNTLEQTHLEMQQLQRQVDQQEQQKQKPARPAITQQFENMNNTPSSAPVVNSYSSVNEGFEDESIIDNLYAAFNK